MDKTLVSLFEEFEDPEESLPPEMLLDPYHPKNDRFYSELNHTKRAVLATSNALRPMHRQAVAMYRGGMNYTEIAKKLDSTLSTVSKWVNAPQAKRLSALMDHHQHQVDGPNSEHRKAILYRISMDNEKYHPSISIKALQEINKMSGTYETGDNIQNQVNIQINGELLPRGALDVLPDTYETRQLSNVIEGDFGSAS